MEGGAPVKPSDPIKNYFSYVYEHGTREEVENATAELAFLRELRSEFPESEWEPMRHVKLIEHLVDRADRLAARRQDTAKRQRYKDYQGKIGRSVVEERAEVRGQVAAQVMLGLPIGKPDTKEEARDVGNIGGGNDAFIPHHNPLHHKLIVDPRTKDHITCWLVVPEGSTSYRLAGWIKAAEAKVKEYWTVRQREGGQSKSYWVPPEMLHTVDSWWS